MGEALQSSRTGDLLNGVYELHEALSVGAEHDTYRATDTRRATSVQITMLKAELALRAGAVDRFLALPRALSALRHPHVAQTLGIELDETGIPFVVREDVQGEPLAKTLASFAQGMPLGVAVAVLSPVIDAVATAHALGLVHGRLGRDQIQLVRSSGSSLPKLTGFGSAPEGADARSDVWALGALLYEALSGESAGRPGKRHTPLDELSPHLPAELAALVERCLGADPSMRPADAAAVRDALAKVTGRMRTGERKPEPVAAPASAATKGKPAQAPSVPSDAPPARKLREGEEATEPVTPAKPAEARSSAVVATPAADPLPLGLGATMAAPVSVAVLQEAIEEARVRSKPPSDGFELASDADRAAAEAETYDDDDPELSIEMPADSERPKTVAGRRSKRPAAADKGEIKTLSDLAAAFAPIEGSDRIGQTETNEASVVRNFKKAFDEAQAQAQQAKGRRPARAGAIPASPEAKAAVVDDKPGTSGPLKSRKELREGSKPTARGITEDQLRHIRSVAGEEKKDDDSVIGMLLFLLFVLLLPFATPILVDPASTPLPKVLEGREKIAAGAFGVLTTIALIRTWALQIRSSPALLRPVTTTLKLVTAAVCVLVATFFLPAGALGPVGRASAAFLPWGAGGFYVFLALYGLARAVREAGQGALRAIGMTMLYLTAFFGSYRVLATTVMVDAKHKAAMRAKLGKTALGGSVIPGGTGLDGVLAKGAPTVPDAGITPDKPLEQRKEVGASEADDMAAINDLSEGKQKKGKQLTDLSGKIGDMLR
jgi:hypothetical protein